MDKQKNKTNKKNDKRNKTLGIILSILLILILAFGAKIQESFQKKITYNEFVEMVNENRVKKADVDASSGKIIFELNDSDRVYRTNYPYSDGFIENLLVKNVDIKTHQTSWLLSVLRYGGISIVMLILTYLIISGGMTDFDVELVENNHTTFADIAGMDEIKEDMLFLSEMMKDEKYRKSGARIPRGILLQGPPGNGKTLLARAFAGETGVNFIAVNACDFGSQFVGIGSSKIKKVFEKAKKNAPCVIFIDELDSVGTKRSNHSDSASKEMNTILTSLLNQMDGFKQNDNIMVLAATNKIENLDEALIRPGRFDRQFMINYPDFNTRKEIFELYTKNIKIAQDVNIDSLARRTFGYSASKIECVVNEAAILAIRNKVDVVTNDDFEEAILQMDIKGHLKKNFKQSEYEKEITAYHEAGHAVISFFLTHKKVSSISIIPTTSGAGGFTITENDEGGLCPLDDYKAEIVMLYGGRAAERVLRGSIMQSTAGSSNDIERATSLASSYVNILHGMDYSFFGECGVKKVIELTDQVLSEAWSMAVKLITDKWEYVDILAKKLMEKEIISGDEFLQIMNQ